MDDSEFMHRVAHDLKAPLNGISSLIDFLAKDYGDRLDAAGLDQIELIQRLAARGVTSIEALRLLARVERAALTSRRVDLGDMASQLALTVAGRSADARVSFHLGADLPCVLADRTLTSILLDRLLSNAILYNERRDRHVWFDRVAMPSRDLPSGHDAYAVRDDGIGIPARHHDDVFDMFRRLHAHDKYRGGVGAGLTVARAIVARHGGTMWIESAAGAGTTIVFTLPIAVDRVEAGV